MRRSLSNAARWLSLSDRLGRKVQAPPVTGDISILLTETLDTLVTEDGRYLITEQVVG